MSEHTQVASSSALSGDWQYEWSSQFADLVSAAIVDPGDEADFGDETSDYIAGGDNEGMEEDPRANQDYDDGAGMSDEEDSDDEVDGLSLIHI